MPGNFYQQPAPLAGEVFERTVCRSASRTVSDRPRNRARHPGRRRPLRGGDARPIGLCTRMSNSGVPLERLQKFLLANEVRLPAGYFRRRQTE